MVTIVYAHPWHGSFNKAILDTITTKFDNKGVSYNLIDLNKDGFNPTLTDTDLALFSRGKSPDPLVEKYQDAIRNSNEIVFIFPIWWGSMPAILKGFFDKVWLVNFSHNYNNGWTPLLNINKGTVITTTQSPTEKYKTLMEDWFIGQNLNAVGINNVTWINNDQTSHGAEEKRLDFLKKIAESI